MQVLLYYSLPICGRVRKQSVFGLTILSGRAGLLTLSTGNIWTKSSLVSGNNRGPAEELWKSRVHLLSEQEQAAMEPLVQIKTEKSKERILVNWDPAKAKQRLSSFLFD
jgi:hypothetical protein